MLSVAWTSIMIAVLILLWAYILMFVILNQTGGFWQLHQSLNSIDPSLLDPFAGGNISIDLAIS